MNERTRFFSVVGIVVIGCFCLVGTIVAQFIGKEPAPIYGYAVTTILGYIGGTLQNTTGRDSPPSGTQAAGS